MSYLMMYGHYELINWILRTGLKIVWFMGQNINYEKQQDQYLPQERVLAVFIIIKNCLFLVGKQRIMMKIHQYFLH